MELMIVIAIVSIAAAIAVPNLIGWMPKQRLSLASRNILAVLQQSRLTAVKENADVTIIFNRTTESYSVFIDTNSSGTLDAGETLLKTNPLPGGIDLTSTTFASDTISFNRRGLPTNFTGGTVTVGRSGFKSKRINVNQTGNSKIL